RQTMNVVLRLFAERQDVFLRTAAAAQTEAGEEKRGRHDLHKVPAGDRLKPFAGPGWEFPLDPLAELRRIRQLLEAAPIFGADVRLRARWRNGFHRWQAEQFCKLSTFQLASALVNQLFARCWCGF